MADPGDPRRKAGWDPIGFLVMICLLIAFGGAILYAIQWFTALFATAK